MIQLINDDFFNIYKSLPKGSIIITDPPFNAGKSFDNDNLPEEKWVDFCNMFSDSLKEIEPLNILCEISKKDIEMQKALDRNLKLSTTLDRAITQNPCYVPFLFGL